MSRMGLGTLDTKSKEAINNKDHVRRTQELQTVSCQQRLNELSFERRAMDQRENCENKFKSASS